MLRYGRKKESGLARELRKGRLSVNFRGFTADSCSIIIVMHGNFATR